MHGRPVRLALPQIRSAPLGLIGTLGMGVAAYPCVIRVPDSLQTPEVDGPLATLAFRLCRMILARKVLWDEDVGFDIPQFAAALDAEPSAVREVLAALCHEGWVVPEVGGERPILTERGLAALLGRASGPSRGKGGSANGAASAPDFSIEERPES
jgi:hypothetical protein